jgi:hypothetical protein
MPKIRAFCLSTNIDEVHVKREEKSLTDALYSTADHKGAARRYV